MLITRKSPISGKISSRVLHVTPEQMAAYEKSGALIQNVFPT